MTIHKKTLAEQATLLKLGKVSSVELCQHYLNRIDRLYTLTSSHPKAQSALKPIRATVYRESLEDNDIPTLKRSFPSDHAALLIEFKWLTDSPAK